MSIVNCQLSHHVTLHHSTEQSKLCTWPWIKTYGWYERHLMLAKKICESTASARRRPLPERGWHWHLWPSLELTMIPTCWVATTDALLRKKRMKWFGTIKHHLPVGASLGLYWSTNRCEKDTRTYPHRLQPSSYHPNTRMEIHVLPTPHIKNTSRWNWNLPSGNLTGCESHHGFHWYIRYIIYKRAIFTHSPY